MSQINTDRLLLKDYKELLRQYIRLHVKFLRAVCRKFLLKTDKNVFATMFNIKSVLYGKGARLMWNGGVFVVTDEAYDWFRYKIRHQQQCNMAYKGGVLARAESLADVYFLKKIDFKQGDVFIDCGANVGDLKLWFEMQSIDIEYIGFEPSPVEFKCLKENVSPSVVHNVGLWNEEGELKFYVSSQGADSSLIEPKDYDDVITSRVYRLDAFVNSRVKCLKLEAEGAEPEVVEGLGDKLELVEYITADLGYERGKEAESTLIPATNFLLHKGFELVDVQHERVCGLYRNMRF